MVTERVDACVEKLAMFNLAIDSKLHRSGLCGGCWLSTVFCKRRYFGVVAYRAATDTRRTVR